MKKTALVILMIIISSTMVYFETSAQSYNIPSWIKNNAKWWSTSQISDHDFAKGLEYLIKNGIINVPQTTKSEDSEQQIPNWLRNNAGWWSQGLLSDDEFLKGITYLIKVGIIVIDSSMKISSEVFTYGAIPLEYTCDGSDVSPSLSFSGVPEGTKSLALIMDDPDAPMGTFVHWLVWNISPTKSGIVKAEKLSEPQGTTDFGTKGYGGPCPPSGTHRYFFKLYALDTMLDLKDGSKKLDLENAMNEHIIDKAELIAKYSR